MKKYVSFLPDTNLDEKETQEIFESLVTNISFV